SHHSPHLLTTTSIYSLIHPHPRSTLFPYTTLFRSQNETSQKRKVPVKLIQVDSNTGKDWQRATPKSDTGDAELHIYEVPVLNERSEEHTSELQSRFDLVCRLLLEKKKNE